MKIFGLHWAAHIVYLTTLLAGLYFGINKIKEAVFLKTEVGQVQRLSLPVVRQSNRSLLRSVDKNADAYKTPKNEANRQLANRAVNVVTNFIKKCDAVQQRLNTGTKPVQIDWPNDLLIDYYLLGDSLQTILPQNAEGQKWLDRCLFSDYRACPSEQLSSWLITKDTAEIRTLLQNLNLKAELALYTGLTVLEKNTRGSDLKFDAFLPVISYSRCPQAGVPFEAEIFVAPYSTVSENVKVKINGKSVPLEKGLAHYETTVASTGLPKLNVQFIVTNPLTGETRVYTKEM